MRVNNYTGLQTYSDVPAAREDLRPPPHIGDKGPETGHLCRRNARDESAGRLSLLLAVASVIAPV